MLCVEISGCLKKLFGRFFTHDTREWSYDDADGTSKVNEMLGFLNLSYCISK